jgi:hypothetical protein
VGAVVARQVQKLLALYLQEGSIVEYRYLLSTQHYLVKGLAKCAQSFQPPTSLGAFLELYRFTSATDNQIYAQDGSKLGMTPLFYATMVGNIPVLKALLAMPEVLMKINMATKQEVISQRYGTITMKGTTPLLAAAASSRSPATLELLVTHGATTRIRLNHPHFFRRHTRSIE